MALDQQGQDDVLAYLNDQAEKPIADGGIGKAIDTTEEFVMFLWQYWDDVTKPGIRKNAGKRRALGRLKQQVQDEDDGRAARDQEIADLEDELNPRGGRP